MPSSKDTTVSTVPRHIDLSTDDLLSTTRAVRKRLDLGRPVARELIDDCLRLAQQAPTGGGREDARFLVVTDAEIRNELGDLYRRAWELYISDGGILGKRTRAATDEGRARQRRIGGSARYLADNLEHVPVLVIPCIGVRTEGQSPVFQASAFGSLLPAVWSFMLAARSRGLGTAWTTLHLYYEQEAAGILGIPFDRVTQAALIPVAHTIGRDFRPGARRDLDQFACWNTWTDAA